MIRKDLADADAVSCRLTARQYNVQRRHLNQEAKRALIADQLRETPERADGWIADALATSAATVGRIRLALESTGDIDGFDQRTRRNGAT